MRRRSAFQKALLGMTSLVIMASIAVVRLRNPLDAHTVEEQPGRFCALHRGRM